MQAFLVGLVALVALVVAVLVLGVVGPFVALAGLIAVAVVLLNPGGAGSRLRASTGWWAIPGMRGAAAGAVPFAALLFGYAVAVPMLAFAVTHAISLPRSAPSASAGAVAAAATGEATTAPTPTPIPKPTPTTAPAPTAAPTQVPTPVPAPAPARAAPIVAAPLVVSPSQQGLCGAPANPWSYTFCGGQPVRKPASAFCSYFACAGDFWTSARGFVVECNDGLYAHDGRDGNRGCSADKGVHRTVFLPSHGAD